MYNYVKYLGTLHNLVLFFSMTGIIDIPARCAVFILLLHISLMVVTPLSMCKSQSDFTSNWCSYLRMASIVLIFYSFVLCRTQKGFILKLIFGANTQHIKRNHKRVAWDMHRIPFQYFSWPLTNKSYGFQCQEYDLLFLRLSTSVQLNT